MTSTGAVVGLKCKECERVYDIAPSNVCELCFGQLEVEYDYERIAKLVTRKRIQKGPETLWRYREILPVDSGEPVDLGAGFTPLIRAEKLGRRLGLRHLYIKNDSLNPTSSFKDRSVAVAVTKAREFGFDTVACASTGNLANSVAAHAARAGLKCYIFVPSDLDRARLVAISVYEPTIIAVNGDSGDVNSLCSKIAGRYQWAFVNVQLRPFYAEGSKTIAFEITEQLGWQLPDHVIAPMASGSLITRLRKGFTEMQVLNLVKKNETRLYGVQAEGCAPIVGAFLRNTDLISPATPNTIAKSIAIGNPADGPYALKAIRQTGGTAEAATDAEIIDGIKLLATTEGIITEPSGGAAIAALVKLAGKKSFNIPDRVVVCVSGSGSDSVGALSEAVNKPIVVEPDADSFDRQAGAAGLKHAAEGN
ncbi:MAG: threonine synthase [bacterium]